MGVIADGSLLDTLRRIKAFGVHLVRLDVRQESSRHAEVISELTRHRHRRLQSVERAR